MDEKEIQKKLAKIKQKRLKYKDALEKAPCLTSHVSNPPRNKTVPLSEEEIAGRIKKWRETPDPACESCKICSGDDNDKAD